MPRTLPSPFARRTDCRGCARLRKALADQRALAAMLRRVQEDWALFPDCDSETPVADEDIDRVLRDHGPRRGKP